MTVAKAPPPRMVSIELSGAFAGWACEARADFAAGLLADLQSGSIERIMSVLDAIITTHNFPAGDGTLATSMAAVDPYDGLLLVATELFQSIGRLPKR